MNSNNLRRKLMLRKMSISAPSLRVTTRMPWWLRGVLIFLGLALAAALGAWIYEQGRSFAGFNKDEIQTELTRLRTENKALNEDKDRLTKIAISAESQLNLEKATQTQLSRQIKQMEIDNAKSKEDLAFFETLLPTTAGKDGVAMRNVRASLDETRKFVNVRMLLMQGGKKVNEIRGFVQITLQGSLDGKPYSQVYTNDNIASVAAGSAAAEANAGLKFNLSRYQRIEAQLPVWLNDPANVPKNLMLKNITIKIMQGSNVLATQTSVVAN